LLHMKFKNWNLKIGKITLCAKGFTLLELLVTTSLLAVLAVVTIPYFHRFTDKQTLHQATEQVKSDIHTVQNRALSATDRKSGATEYKWWGIEFLGGNEYRFVKSDSTTDPSSSVTEVRNKSIPDGYVISVNSGSIIWFKILTGRVEGLNSIADSPDKAVVEVKESGVDCDIAGNEDKCAHITIWEGGRVE